MKSREIKTGLVFAVPISDYFIAGLVIRKDGPSLLGSFFRKKHSDLPDLLTLDLSRDNILIEKRFGELGLTNGEWTPIGIMSDFKSENWPVPEFKRQDVLSDEYYKISYNDQLKQISKIHITAEEAKELWGDGSSGYKAMEVHIVKALQEKA